MSDYKNYFQRQLGIKNSKLITSNPKKSVITEHSSGLERMLSPTAIPTPVVAIGVRGSSTGGLPSGTNITKVGSEVGSEVRSDVRIDRLGGYTPVSVASDHTQLYNKTPCNTQINSKDVIANYTPTTGDTHPHQVQTTKGDSPQSVTGASTDSDSILTVTPENPDQSTIDIDVAEEDEENVDDMNGEQEETHNDMDGEESMEDEDDAKAGLHEGKHKKGCTCGFCANMGKFGKKSKKDDGMKESKKCNTCECSPCECDKSNDKMKKDKMDETVKECETCGCKKPNTIHDKKRKPIEEKYSPAFSRMRGLAGLGKRQVSKNGLWEPIGVNESSYKVVAKRAYTNAEENKARTIQTEPEVNETTDRKLCSRCKKDMMNDSAPGNICSICLSTAGEDLKEASYKVVAKRAYTDAEENKARTIQTEPEVNETKEDIRKKYPCPNTKVPKKGRVNVYDYVKNKKRLEEIKMKLDKKSKTGKLNDKENMLQERINMYLTKNNKSNQCLNETFKRHKKLMLESIIH